MKFVLLQIYFAALVLVFSQYSFAQNKVWEPVSQTELRMKTPLVEADADAEVLFWEVRIEDSYHQRANWRSALNHHLRIKVFTERGREKNSKVDIPFGNILDRDSKVIIADIAARTIKPDGSIVELKPEDVFERDIIKGSGVKIKAKSFAVPGIETGAIIEYRWKEVRTDTFNYSRIELARDIPVQYVKYYIKPANVPLGMRLHSFNTSEGFTKEGDSGFYSTTMRNVPALKEEPRMPSEYEIKPWVLVFYDSDKEKQSPEDYWKERGKIIFDYYKNLLKPSGEIKAAAMQAIGDATDPQEKVRRIFEYCRKNIKNVYDDAYRMTPDQLRELKENKSPTEALKRRQGSWHDIDLVFASMLNAVGIDARAANVSIRNDARFNKQFANDYFIRTVIIAAKVGDKWQFYDFSNRNLPYGMIVWTIEDQEALISDASEPFWEKTSAAAAAQSNKKRTAKLRLGDDGILEGEVRIEYTGHLADFYREYNDDESPAAREKYLTETIKKQVGNATEITDIFIENLEDTEKPFVYSFRIRVPAYAERTGKRIFLRPNIFARNTSSLFTAGTRKYDVFFEYAWSEDDSITIELPKGFSAESADSPKAVKDEKAGASLESVISLSDDKKRLSYQRRFSYGKPGALLIDNVNYSGIKELFESIHLADSHSLVLREDSPAAD